MRRIVFGLLCLFIFHLVQANEVTDMAGRKVTVPDIIKKVLPYDSRTSILLYPCASGKMAAKAMLPGQKKYSFIGNDYLDLPEIDIENLEEVLSLKPDMIIAGVYSREKNLNRFNELQRRLKIPVVLVDMSIDKLDKTYEFIGRLIGTEDECLKLSRFLRSVYTQLNLSIKTKSLNGISAYYTIGSTGLMTDPSGSKHTEVFDLMKIPNAAKVDIPSGGHAKVNMEQLLLWNPDYIFTAGFKGESNACNAVKTNKLWSRINAVKCGKVFKVPAQPFGWFDHPPSVNRIPGIIWLNEIFYEQKNEVTKTKIKEFYRFFYKYSLSDQDYLKLFVEN